MELSQPTSHSFKALNVLVLGGGGLQTDLTLPILSELLRAVAKQKGISYSKIRPCDVFDTIIGIGTGGWLAILLGRFRMDLCQAEVVWHKIQRCIDRSYAIKEERLFDQINWCINAHGIENRFYENDLTKVRTCRVAVAAQRLDGQGYCLFRSYDVASAKFPEKLLEGPETTDSFKITQAFLVTGAAKHFLPRQTIKMASSGDVCFQDVHFPKTPHDIASLALEEMLALYGPDVPISSIVDVQPWDRDKPDKKGPPSSVSRIFESCITSLSPRQTSYATGVGQSIKARTFMKEINSDGTDGPRSLGEEMAANFRRKLAQAYPRGGAPPYFRFAPDKNVTDAARQDFPSYRDHLKAIENYCGRGDVKAVMKEAAISLAFGFRAAAR